MNFSLDRDRSKQAPAGHGPDEGGIPQISKARFRRPGGKALSGSRLCSVDGSEGRPGGRPSLKGPERDDVEDGGQTREGGKRNRETKNMETHPVGGSAPPIGLWFGKIRTLRTKAGEGGMPGKRRAFGSRLLPAGYKRAEGGPGFLQGKGHRP